MEPSFVPNMSDLPASLVPARVKIEAALAAGRRAIVLIGPPGIGKTMLARRVGSLLPDMAQREIIEACAMHTLAGIGHGWAGGPYPRAFRAPHHTCSGAALCGTGRASEYFLAMHGVLFLDDVTEFARATMESLTHHRDQRDRQSPGCEFGPRLIIASALPCACGWYQVDAPGRACTCPPSSLASHHKRLALYMNMLHVEEVGTVTLADMRADKAVRA